jgi:very-short-patch-repair endonuclease
MLWQELRRNQCGVRFRRQHSIGDYIADFACLPLKLIIEVDGGYHDNPKQQEADAMRTQWLGRQGYTVLRFTNKEVAYNIDSVIQTIKHQISNLKK